MVLVPTSPSRPPEGQGRGGVTSTRREAEELLGRGRRGRGAGGGRVKSRRRVLRVENRACGEKEVGNIEDPREPRYPGGPSSTLQGSELGRGRGGSEGRDGAWGRVSPESCSLPGDRAPLTSVSATGATDGPRRRSSRAGRGGRRVDGRRADEGGLGGAGGRNGRAHPYDAPAPNPTPRTETDTGTRRGLDCRRGKGVRGPATDEGSGFRERPSTGRWADDCDLLRVRAWVPADPCGCLGC